MRTEHTHFRSDGLKLAASYWWPDESDPDQPRPIVIANSGFTGLRNIHPERFARYLTARGWPCFGFDYRGFAESEGKRNRVLLEEQVRDIVHATAFVSGDDRVDPSRIILLGWGMGAGLVIDAARSLRGIFGLVAVNGFYNGCRVQRAHRGEEGFRDFLNRVERERRQRARSGQAMEVDPFEIYPLDAESRQYVDAVLRRTPGYQAERYSFELADSLLRWDVESVARDVSCPLLIAHGERNLLHPTGEAESLYQAYGGPKELYWIEGAGHTEFMHDDDPKFLALAEHVTRWIEMRVERSTSP